jgi:hypothetical protein
MYLYCMLMFSLECTRMHVKCSECTRARTTRIPGKNHTYPQLARPVQTRHKWARRARHGTQCWDTTTSADHRITARERRPCASGCGPLRNRGRGRARPRLGACQLGLHSTHAEHLEDGRGRGAAHATGGVEGVDAEELVDEAAGDAHHGRAAVLALGVELEGLDLRVVVAHP